MTTELSKLIAENDYQLPEGYVKVSVLLTAREAGIVRRKLIFTAEGTWSAGVRALLGWPESPHGLKAALKRAIEG